MQTDLILARLLVDPNDGAKDISLLIGNTEYITGKDVRKEYYGSSLWIAYIFEGYAVVKVFEDVPPLNSLPGEQDVEIYVDNKFDYFEIEVPATKTCRP